ncbi:MAG: YajG family lipoprotein [Verrucomicrobia bacterium]|nr:YajG family lipoprotein [Verrucomicrobiota bacterium]
MEIPSLKPRDLNGLSVAISEVQDGRVFQNRPPNPSTPSIDGDVTKMSAMERSRMIGRQRNAYGKAMGDVALPGDVTVEQKVQQLVEEGLRARGYQIRDSESDYSVSVKVEEFWGWFTPGMFYVTFEARIKCAVKIDGEEKSEVITVVGYGENKAQVASDANWQLAYRRAFEDFLDNFSKELEKKGF